MSNGDHMSKLMRELEHFAYDAKVALVLIGNDAKGTEGRSDANKLLGSGVIARRARSLITVKEIKNERYLKVTKRLGFTRKEETLIGYRFNDDNHLEFYLYYENTRTNGIHENDRIIGCEEAENETKIDIVQFIRTLLMKGPLRRMIYLLNV